MKANVIVFEAAVFILFVVFYFGLSRAMGKSRARTFFIGAALFSLAIETIAVLGGIKNFFWYQQNSYYKHYPLGGHIIWLGLVPLAVILLWYMVAAISYLAAGALMPKRGSWLRAVVAGAISLWFYLIIEPVAVTNHWWTWNLKSFYLIDVPVLAWVGMFISVFLFTAAFHLTIVEQKDLPYLATLENKTILRKVVKPKKGALVLSWNQLQGVFLFRLVFFLAAFGVAIAPFMALFWAIANRGQIPPKW